MNRKTWLCALVVLGLTALARPTQAVTITEHTIELNAKPGDALERKLNLYDDKLQGTTIYVSVANFKPDPASEGSALLVTDPAELKPDREWIKLSTDKVDLPSTGELVPFTFRVELPTDADPGTHLISLVFSTRPPEADPNSSTVSIGTNLLTNIFLKVAGATIDSIDATFKAGIFTNTDPGLKPVEREKYFVEKKLFFKPPVDFLVRVANIGNTHQKPDGNIKIQNDLFGRISDTILVNTDNLIIMPSISRTFAVDSFGRGLMFGKYRAKLTLVYGNPLRDITKEVDFWIIPLKEIAIALGVLLLLIVIIILLRRISRKRGAAKEKKKEEEIRRTLREEIKQTMREAREADQPNKPAQTETPRPAVASQPPMMPPAESKPIEPPQPSTVPNPTDGSQPPTPTPPASTPPTI